MEKISINQAAEMLGIKPQTLRVGLRLGKFPFGPGYKTSDKNNNYTYVIYAKKFKEYVGVKL